MKIYRNPNKKLVLYSQCGRDYDFEYPVIGYPLTKTGTPTYDTGGKFRSSLVGTASAYWSTNPTKIWNNQDRGTIQFWYYPTTGWDGSGNKYMIYYNGTTDAIYLYSGTTYHIFYLKIDSSDIINYQVAHTTYFTINTWHLIKFMWDKDGIDGSSNTARVYIDDTLASSSDTSFSTGSFASAAMDISNEAGTPSSNYLRGRMDDIRFYDYANVDFSDVDHEDYKISRLYRNPDKRLIKFIECDRDASFTNPRIGYPLNSYAGTNTYSTGKHKYAIDGVLHSLKWGSVWDELPTNEKGCIEFWWKPDTGFDSNSGWIVTWDTSPNANGTPVAHFQQSSSGLRFLVGERAGNSYSYYHPNSNFSVGTWYHLAMAWDIVSGIGDGTNSIEYYVDGSLVSSYHVKWTPVNAHATQQIFSVAGTPVLITNWRIHGSVDSVRFWNYPKTDFSDRFNEFPERMYNINIKSNPDKKLLFYSSMGSDEEFENPVIGLPLTKVGTPTYSTGKFGNAMNGVNNAMWKFNPSDYWYNNNKGTIEFYWKPEATRNGFLIMVRSGSNDFWYISIGSSGLSNPWRFSGGSNADITLTYSFTTGVWYHIAVVWNRTGIDGGSDTRRIYVNGVDQASTTVAYASHIWNNSGDYAIMNHPLTPTSYGKGMIDNFKVYNYDKISFPGINLEREIDITKLIKVA